MGKKDSYFKVNRSLLDHPLWLSEPFTKGQAWVDLIGLAAFKDHTNYYNGHRQEIHRGQLFVSSAFLEKRWKWSRNKVRAYLKDLVKDGMCVVQGTTEGTTITIENYAFFQDKQPAKGTAEGTAEGTTKGTQHKNVINNAKRIVSIDKMSINPKGHFSVDKDGNEIWVREA